MSHYDEYYEKLAEDSRKEGKKLFLKKVKALLDEGFTEDQIKVILKAKELDLNTN